MSKHFFHCIEGVDLILDKAGREAEYFEVDLVATGVAEEISCWVTPSFDWSDWIVSVHNENGRQIAVVPFPSRRRSSTSVVAGKGLSTNYKH